jgi:hypothetical protein
LSCQVVGSGDSFVNHYLPYFRKWLICCLLPAGYFCRLRLLKDHTGEQLLDPPSFFGALIAPRPLCCMYFSVTCLLFQYFFFCIAGVSLSRGLCWFIPEVAVGVLCATLLLTCWSVSPKQIWSQHLVVWEPSWFFSVTWHGEASAG